MGKILIHVPHSSLKIPEVMFSKILISKSELEELNFKMCDFYVDKLVYGRENILKFNYSRLFCDVERYKDDNLEVMAKKGMGAIYTKDYNGNMFIKYDNDYKNDILKKYYDEHHKKLDNMCNLILKSFKKCLIIDLHSFSDDIVLKTLDKKSNPDICIGINHDFCDKYILDFVVNFFKKNNYSVAINYPYEGSIVPNNLRLEYGNSLISIMIEINKRIYFDNFEINKEKFAKLKDDINFLLLQLDKLI